MNGPITQIFTRPNISRYEAAMRLTSTDDVIQEAMYETVVPAPRDEPPVGIRILNEIKRAKQILETVRSFSDEAYPIDGFSDSIQEIENKIEKLEAAYHDQLKIPVKVYV